MATDAARRKDLKQQYRENPPQAGVYRIVNEATGKGLLKATANLPAAANRLAFAQSTGSLSALDQRLRRDLGEAGASALRFEILDVLEVEAGTPAEDVAGDLEALESLWREKLDPATLY